MLKELIAIGMATTLLTAPPQNTNDGTYYQDVNITESYEYETNEVNSVNDLVVGNIYKFKIENYYVDSNFYIPSNYVIINDFETQDSLSISGQSWSGIRVYDKRLFLLGLFKNSNLFQGTYVGYRTTNQNVTIDILDCYFVYDDYGANVTDIIQYISASDYLGEKTITIEPVETEGLYNLAYHFLYSRIYTNTQLQGMETTLFGTTINMNMWLSHTTAIVIICLLLLVLIKFVIWLFKIVSGGMLWQ